MLTPAPVKAVPEDRVVLCCTRLNLLQAARDYYQIPLFLYVSYHTTPNKDWHGRASQLFLGGLFHDKVPRYFPIRRMSLSQRI